jgi:hypothetical protein
LLSKNGPYNVERTYDLEFVIASTGSVDGCNSVIFFLLQIAFLERVFAARSHPTAVDIAQMAEYVGVEPTVVKVSFCCCLYYGRERERERERETEERCEKEGIE